MVLTLVHSFFTVAMFGFMVAVQLVIYPQFRHAGDHLRTYSDAHTRVIVRGLAVLAPVEVLLAGWLFVDTPTELHRSLVFGSGALLAAGWIVTGAWFAPLHGRIHDTADPALVERLIRTNWIRTAIWAVRALTATLFVHQLT